MTDFVHLHCHQQWSLLDGCIRMKDIFPRLKELGLKAHALTDHGYLYGAVAFYAAAREAGIKPIIGCEMYLSQNHALRAGEINHLVLLAQNLEGYQNLCRLCSIASLDGFWKRPRIDLELLKRFGTGLIGLSACLGGEVPALILKGDLEGAKEKAARYAAILPGRFYLELQENGLEKQKLVNRGLQEIARELGLPLVATNDCHYLYKEDALAHEVLVCIGLQKTLADPTRIDFETDQLYLKSPDEMAELFADCPEAIANTVAIADSCELELDLKSYHFPRFEVQGSLEEELFALAREGLAGRWPRILLNAPGADIDRYRERLEEELAMIAGMGFCGYFLMVAEIVNWAKGRGIPVGPGRGSAAGSLAAFALAITDLDPIRWELLFERFLNPERVSMPDIDVDFCQERRDEVIAHVVERYGRDRVCQIVTFGSLGAKQVVRDVARVFGWSFSEADRVAKLIPEQVGITLEEAFAAEPRLTEAAREERVARVVEVAKRLEGLYRHASVHAAGLVVAPGPLTDYLPLCREKEGGVCSQYDMLSVERAGMVKFDFLGLKNLTMIRRCCEMLPGLDLDRLPLDDPASYALLQAGDTIGVFQLESAGMREILTRMRPNSFEDLIAVVALYRPGPLGSGMIEEYIERKAGRVEVTYPHALLERVLEPTYGVIVYQEQVMQIARSLAGYTLAGADLLRRAMGKKDPVKMEKERARFVEGAVARGVGREQAVGIFELMAKFAEYGFNKSHSAAYALLAYQTAYLKAHHPREFFSALLTCDAGNDEKVAREAQDCRQHGVALLPPEVNRSGFGAAVEGEAVRLGLSFVKNVGDAAVEAILAARGERPFAGIDDFARRVDLSRVNRRVVESLVFCGAFDALHPCRAALSAAVPSALELGASRQRDRDQFSLFGEEELAPPLTIPATGEWPSWERLSREKEVLGFYCSAHPAESYRRRSPWSLSVERFRELPEGKEGKVCVLVGELKVTMDKKGKTMAFGQIEDETGRVEAIFFADLFRTGIEVGDVLAVRGTLSRGEAGVHLVANLVKRLNR